MPTTENTMHTSPSELHGTMPTTNTSTTNTNNDTAHTTTTTYNIPPTSQSPTSPKHTPLSTTMTPPKTGCIRLLFNNVNGLATEEPALLSQVIRSYTTHHATIVGLIETKRNWAITDKTSQPLRNMVKARTNIRPQLVTAKCQECHTCKNLKQPGGVCQLTMNTVINLVSSSGGDSLGRWAWQTLRLDGNRLLYVITAYRVCDKPPVTSAQTTAWHQQYRGLVKRGLRDPDPRQRFLSDLREFLQELKQQGHVYIVGWDANDPYDCDTIDDFLTDTDMIDCFDDLLLPRPPTHNRGSQQIDQLSMSSSLFGYLDKAFIHDPDYGEGDHSYFGMDFHLTALIQRNIHTLDETQD